MQPSKTSNPMHVCGGDGGAPARLSAEKFPSNQRNFPNLPAAVDGTKLPNDIDQVNCANTNIGYFSGRSVSLFSQEFFDRAQKIKFRFFLVQVWSGF
jgi:hypothetical protein